MNAADLQILPLDAAQMKTVYQNWMVRDFPATERKPLRMIEAACERGEYQCLGLYIGSLLVGYALFVQIGTLYLLDYFAVDAPHRGKGMGSAFLRMLTVRLSDAETVIVEAENPAYAKCDADRIQQQRRVDFYLRADCAETSVLAKVFGVEYVLLELPVRRVHFAEEIRDAYAKIYKSFLPKPMYLLNIHLH